MRKMKLSLRLEELRVESFEIVNERQAKGTVRGHDLCSDVCSVSGCNPTCGILPASAESNCEAMAGTAFCGDTQDFSDCGPCCV